MGEVQYRTSLDFAAIEPTEAAIWRHILANVATMDQFIGALNEASGSDPSPPAS